MTENVWARLLFGLRRKYSAPILFLLYSKKELTFDQIYDICSRYAAKGEEKGEEKILARFKRGALVAKERSPRYAAISRGSVSSAITELKNKKHITREPRLQERGRSYAVYVLTAETKTLMEQHIKK